MVTSSGRVGEEIHRGGGLPRPRVAALAAAEKKHWVLGVRELHELEWTDRRIEGAVADGFMFRRHRGVYVVGRRELSFEGRCRAAVLACGPGSAVSHWAAAALWGFRRWTGWIHVTAPRGRQGHPGLVLHRPRSFGPADVGIRHGIAVTSVARTLIDLSPGKSPDTVGGWMHEATVQRVLDHRRVLEVLQRLPRHRGASVLEAALAAEVLDTRTGLEDVMVALWRRAGLPAPTCNHYLWTGEKHEEVDLCSEDLRLVVEADGGRYHSTRWRKRRDAEKDARLRAVGWTVVRVPELRMTLEPSAVVADLRAAAAAGPRNPPPGWISQPT